MTGSTRGQQKVKRNWWDIREKLGSEVLSEVVDDSTNSEPGTMKGHIAHVGKDVGVIRGADGTEYSFAIQDILANPHGRFGKWAELWEVSFLPEGDRATQIVIRRVGVTYKVITLDGSEHEKNQIMAATLALLFGALGAHKFYLGYNTQGTIMLLMGTLGWFLLVPPFASLLIGLIEAVIYFSKNEQEFYDTYEAKQRAWF